MSTYSKRLQKWRVEDIKPIITCCLVLPLDIIMHNAYIGGRSENNIKCVVMHNDLGWKNLTTLYNCSSFASSLAL